MNESAEYMMRDVAHDTELARLRVLERVYDPYSHHALGFAAIQPGWRCLELGAGAGSIAWWLVRCWTRCPPSRKRPGWITSGMPTGCR